MLAHDQIWREVAARVGAIAETVAPEIVFAPQALGNHVDHRQTVRAVVSLGRPTVWYRDLPYATRAPEEAPPPGLPDGLVPLAVPVTTTRWGRSNVQLVIAISFISWVAVLSEGQGAAKVLAVCRVR